MSRKEGANTMPMFLTLRGASRRKRLLRLSCGPGAWPVASVALVGPLLCLATALAQGVDPGLWGVDNNITGIVRSGNTIYVAGAFTHAGPNTGCGVPIDRTTGKPVLSFPKVAGVLNAVVPDDHGGWYVGGALVGVGGLPRRGVAHIRADGSVDDWDPDSDGRVLALALKDGTLYAGGQFSRIGGEVRSNIAALDLATGRATDWDPGADRPVLSLLLTDSTAYAGGNFGYIGGNARNSLAELDLETGLAADWNPDVGFSGFPGSVRALAILGDTVYVGGSFGSAGGQYRYNIGAVSARTGLATAWNPWASGYPDNPYDEAPYVSVLIPGRGTIYVAGHFARIGGQERGGLAEVDLVTGEPTAWNPDPRLNPGFEGFAPHVTSLVVADRTAYLSGNWSFMGDVERKFIAEVDRDTGAPTDWNPRANSIVDVLSLSGNVVYAGGRFNSIGEWQSRKNLAAFDVTTGKLKQWNPNPDGLIVYDLVVHGDRVYVGGHFWTIGGQVRGAIAALDTITGSALEWAADMDGVPTVLKTAGDRLYVGGAFTTVGGIPRKHLVSFDLASGALTDWDPSPDLGDVEDFIASGETVYIGGSFRSVGGVPRKFLAAVDATTGAVRDWHPEPSSDVHALALRGSIVFVGGAFKDVGGQARGRLAALDATTGEVLDWMANAAHDNPNFARVFALELAGDKLYVGGSFHSLGSEPRSGLAAVDAASGTVLPWNPSPGGPTTDYPLQPAVIWSLTAYENTLYVGGRFRFIGTVPVTTLAALWIGPAPPDDPGPMAERLALAPMAPNPIHSSATIRFALPAAGPVDLAVFDVQGRRIASLIDHVLWPAGTHEIPLRAEGWPPGFYFCRLGVGSSTATRKFLVLK